MTGEYRADMHIMLELADEHPPARDHTIMRLRETIAYKIEAVLREHEGKEVVLYMDAIDAPKAPLDIKGYGAYHIRYSAVFTAVLLDWRHAEVGDCVHRKSIQIETELDKVDPASLPRLERFGGCTFAWEGRWWKRVE